VLHGLLGLRFPGFPAAFRVANTLTLRVSATDAAGGSISETILRGYGVAP
jgi:hypothetical protein